jgi:hypothetical protein
MGETLETHTCMLQFSKTSKKKNLKQDADQRQKQERTLLAKMFRLRT